LTECFIRQLCSADTASYPPHCSQITDYSWQKMTTYTAPLQNYIKL